MEWCAREPTKDVIFCFDKHSGYVIAVRSPSELEVSLTISLTVDVHIGTEDTHRQDGITECEISHSLHLILKMDL